MKVHDVVQFTENHKWCGCFGMISNINRCGDDTRYMVGVPMPRNDGKTSTAYIFCMESENEIEYIGRPVMVLSDRDDD